MRTKCRKQCLRWSAIWIAILALGVGARLTVWTMAPVSSIPPVLFGSLNALSLLLTPGDLLAWRLTEEIDHRSIGMLLAIGGSSSLCWTVLLATLLIVRRMMLPPRARTSPPVDQSRRRFLVDASGAGVGLLSVGGVANAAFIEPWSLRLEQYTVDIADLPPELDGFRLAQISDTHLGPRVPAAFIQRAIDLAISVKPDLFLLTGDYVTLHRRYIVPAAEMFKAVVAASAPGKPPVGVLGNHDWHVGGPAMREALTSIGVRMIDNAHVYLDAATRQLVDNAPARGMCVVGVGDLSGDRADTHRAFQGVPPEMPRLLLSHQPDVAERVDFTGRLPRGRTAKVPRVDVMFAGHTHGGQIKLPLIGAPLVPSNYGQKYIGGVVQGPAFPVVMSRGVGMSVLPIRWGAPPEIVAVTLRRKPTT